jgi:hypothetical protein
MKIVRASNQVERLARQTTCTTVNTVLYTAQRDILTPPTTQLRLYREAEEVGNVGSKTI